MATKRIPGEFKGNPMFQIFEVDEDGQPTSEYAVVKFGIRKAKAVLEHMDDLKAFVEENDK